MTVAVLERRTTLAPTHAAVRWLRPGDLLPLAGCLVAALVLAADYRGAGHDARTGAKYALFWVGLLAAFVPIGARLTNRTTPRPVSAGLVGLLSVVTYLPKLLRSPGRPGFIDELLHLSQVERMLAAGREVPNSVVPVIGHYPGLHLATIAVHLVTHLPVWWSALAVVGLAHAALLLAVFRLAELVSGDSRLAGVAALLYASGPGFLFFTTQFAYESLGIATAAWSVVAAVEAARRGRPRSRWVVLSAGLCVLTALTHHVSAIFASAVLIALAASWRRRHGRTPATTLLARLALLCALVTSVWIGVNGWAVIDYVLPTGTEVRSFLPGGHGVAHHAFAGSVLPGYERVAGYATPPLLLALLVSGFLGRDRLRRLPAASTALTAVAACYPLSLPLLASANGLVWAHRSWPFLYVAMAPVLAAGLLRLADGPVGRRARTLVSGSVVAAALAALCSAVMLLGNTASEVNEPVQFPVPDVLGAQAGSSTPDELAMAAWFGAHAGTDARFVTDPMTAANLVLYGTGTYVGDFPTWWLTESAGGTDPRLMARLRAQHVGWLVVDRRMYDEVPLDGVYYDAWEPGAYAHANPVSLTAWRALSGRPWATLRYENSQVAVFKLQVP